MEDHESMLKELREEVPNANLENYNSRQIEMMHRAVFGACEVKGEATPPSSEPERKEKRGRGRTRTRVSPSIDPSYVLPIFRAFIIEPEIRVEPLKTGVSVKYSDEGYETNLLTFSQLKVFESEIKGNLFLNQVRDEEIASMFVDLDNAEWFRGYLLIPKIKMSEIIELLDSERTQKLLDLAKEGQKKRLSRSKRIKG